MKKKISFTHKHMLMTIVLIVASNLAIFGVTLAIARDNIVSRIETASENLLATNLRVLDSYFTDIDALARSVIYNEDLISTLKSSADTSQGMTLLRTFERLFYHARADLRVSFFKVNAPTRSYSIYQSAEYAVTSDYRESAWYARMLESREDRLLITNAAGEDDYVHALVYRVRDVYTDAVVGYLYLSLDLSALQDRLLIDYQEVEGVTIFDRDGNALFESRPGAPFPEALLAEDGTSDTVRSFALEDRIYYYATSAQTHWRVALAVSKHTIFSGLNRITTLSIVTLLCVLAVAVALGNRASRKLSANYDRLFEGMNEAKRGTLRPVERANDEDDIGLLISEFNNMLARINELMRNVEVKQKLLDEAEIKALQQQINPHFIYNTLETVMGLASEGMYPEVVEVCRCMSAMLRYNTRMDSVTSLRAELEQVSNYLRVIRLRMEGRFAYTFETEESCLETAIMKFTLQPLVENAITHGFRNAVSGNHITLRVSPDDGAVLIVIQDDGCGMPAERLRAIHEEMERVDADVSSYANAREGNGLLNVYLRLRLFYAGKSTFTIQSAPGEGTRITLRIPGARTERIGE